MTSYLFYQGNVADTETEDEAPRVRFSEGLLRGGHRHLPGRHRRRCSLATSRDLPESRREPIALNPGLRQQRGEILPCMAR